MKINNFFYVLFFICFVGFSVYAENFILDEKNYESLGLEGLKPEITELVVHVPVSIEKLKDFFPSLVSLKIMPNLISSDEFQKLIYSFPNLEVLDVSCNKVKQKEIPLFTVSMPNLKQLFIASIDDVSNEIQWADFKNLAEYAPHLELLDASFNHVSYFHALEMEHLTMLRTLILRSTEIEDTAVQFLKKLEWIESLDLSNTRIHSFAVNFAISKMSTLKGLLLGHCNIGKSGIRNISKSLKDLNCLSLPFTELGDAEVQMILEGLPNLEQLDISKNYISQIGYDYIIGEAMNNKQSFKLRKLKISPCKAKFKNEVDIESARLKTNELIELSSSFEELEIIEEMNY